LEDQAINITIKKSSLKKSFILIVTFFVLLISIILSLNAQRVEAQTSLFQELGSQFGSSCVANTGTCSTGTTHLYDMFPDIKFTGLTSQEVYKAMAEKYTDINNEYVGDRMCANKDVTEIIKVESSVSVCVGNPQECAAQFGVNELTYFNEARFYLYARTCGVGTKGMLAVNDEEESKLAACCPSGYVHVIDTGGYHYKQSVPSGGQLVTAGKSACCPTGGLTPSAPGYPAKYSNGQCYNSGNIAISGAINDNSVIGQSLGVGANTRLNIATLKGAESFCANNNGCTKVGEGVYKKSSDLKASGYTTPSCQKCFEPEEAMAIDTTARELIVCDPGASDGSNTKRTALINDSIESTLAYLRADTENRPLLQSCLESGGIWIFVGCVDPTPLGIITGVIRIALGVMGGVALLQLIWAGLLYQSGNEKKIADARQKVIATLTGIAVLVFSILILRIIGVNILDVLPANSF
jgi:hypothetical protein